MGSETKGLKFHTKALAISALAGISEEREEFCLFNRSGDGFVCEKEVKHALHNLELNPANIDINKMIDDAEIDGDGTLSKSELITAVSQLEDFGNEVEVQNNIRCFDKSKNDFVSVAELKDEKIEQLNKETQGASENILQLKRQVKKKQKFTKSQENDYIKYEAFVTVSIQSKPNTKIGCKLQEADIDGVSEVEEWKKRWRRNAAMRSASKIFPKTWWMLLAKLEIFLYQKESIKLKLTTYYWLCE